MKKIISIVLFSTLYITGTGQVSSNDTYIRWSSKHKLTIDDFKIKTADLQSILSSFAQFSISFKVNGFDFMTRNFNKRVENCIIKSASWIDTTKDVNISLRYQQTLFDLAEIYARQFRQELKKNRAKITKGFDFINRLNEQAMAAFAERRLKYDQATNYGQDNKLQEEWEQTIQNELEGLKDYAIEER